MTENKPTLAMIEMVCNPISKSMIEELRIAIENRDTGIILTDHLTEQELLERINPPKVADLELFLSLPHQMDPIPEGREQGKEKKSYHKFIPKPWSFGRK